LFKQFNSFKTVLNESSSRFSTRNLVSLFDVLNFLNVLNGWNQVMESGNH